MHKWDVMDNIEKVAVPLNRIATDAAGNKVKEVESGEVIEGGSSGFGSWAKKLEPATATVLAPAQILSTNVKRVNKKDNTSLDMHSGDATITVDSPEAKPAVSYLIGEDVEGLDGIDYDCEAPDDGDEDVL